MREFQSKTTDAHQSQPFRSRGKAIEDTNSASTGSSENTIQNDDKNVTKGTEDSIVSSATIHSDKPEQVSIEPETEQNNNEKTETIEPDKVSDYNRSQFVGNDLFYEDVAGKGYSEGLVLEFFYFDNITSDELNAIDSSSRNAILQKVWEFSPKSAEKKIPLVVDNVHKQFAIRLLDGKTIFSSVTYFKEQSNNRYKLSIDFLTSDNTPVFQKAGETLYISSLKKDILMEGVEPDEVPFDNSFPPIPAGLDPQPKNRQNAFFSQKNNSGALSAIYTYANSARAQAIAMNDGIDGKIGKYPAKIEKEQDINRKKKLQDELEELQKYKEQKYRYPFGSIVQNGTDRFYVEGAFQRAGNDSGSVANTDFKIAYLGGQPGGIVQTKEETSNQDKTFGDGKIDAMFLNYPDQKEHPNILGLDQIPDKERELVKRYVIENIYQQGLKDTHFDRILTFGNSGVIYEGPEDNRGRFGTLNKSEIAYSFTVEKAKKTESVPDAIRMKLPEEHTQLNIFVKRLGQISENDIADPDVLRIKDVHQYSDDNDFVSFVTARYPAIKMEDITGETREKMIESVDKIIRSGSQTPEWYKVNYGITIINNPDDVRSQAAKLRYFIQGVNEPAGHVRAKVRSRTAESPGGETSAAVGTPGVELISDELEGLKAWDPNELKYLEMSLQKLSKNLLGSFNGTSYFRQKYNLQAKTYNKVAGLRHGGEKTIVIYDSGFSSGRTILGGTKDLSSTSAYTITHESGHDIQHHTPLIGGKKQAGTNGDLFNKFYTSIQASGPTNYSRSRDISSPEKEFFPEALTLFLHDPEFMHRNFPKIYMWLLFLQTKGYSPTEVQSKAFVTRWESFVTKNGVEPNMIEIVNIVFNE